MPKPAATSTDTTRAIIYARVSSDKAGGPSVEEQLAECRAVCDRNGWPVAEVLTDNDRSASRFATVTVRARPAEEAARGPAEADQRSPARQ